MKPSVLFTDARAGSFAPGTSEPDLAIRGRSLTGHPTTWLSQVHGADVVVVDHPGEGCGSAADAAVTACSGAALCVVTADCAPLLLGSTTVVAAVHAGWRGLAAGVIDHAVEAMRDAGATAITAWLGPCIRSRCYEFGPRDLDAVIAAVGPEVASTTAWGAPALDVSAGVHAVLGRLGVDEVDDTGVCTACSPVHFSHRARGDSGRQAAFIWLEP